MALFSMMSLLAQPLAHAADDCPPVLAPATGLENNGNVLPLAGVLGEIKEVTRDAVSDDCLKQPVNTITLSQCFDYQLKQYRAGESALFNPNDPQSVACKNAMLLDQAGDPKKLESMRNAAFARVAQLASDRFENQFNSVLNKLALGVPLTGEDKGLLDRIRAQPETIAQLGNGDFNQAILGAAGARKESLDRLTARGLKLGGQGFDLIEMDLEKIGKDAQLKSDLAAVFGSKPIAELEALYVAPFGTEKSPHQPRHVILGNTVIYPNQDRSQKSYQAYKGQPLRMPVPTFQKKISEELAALQSAQARYKGSTEAYNGFITGADRYAQAVGQTVRSPLDRAFDAAAEATGKPGVKKALGSALDGAVNAVVPGAALTAQARKLVKSPEEEIASSSNEFAQVGQRLSSKWGLDEETLSGIIQSNRVALQKGRQEIDRGAEKTQLVGYAAVGVTLAAGILATGGYGASVLGFMGIPAGTTAAAAAVTTGATGLLVGSAISAGGGTVQAALKSYQEGGDFLCNLRNKVSESTLKSLGPVEAAMGTGLGLILPGVNSVLGRGLRYVASKPLVQGIAAQASRNALGKMAVSAIAKQGSVKLAGELTSAGLLAVAYPSVRKARDRVVERLEKASELEAQGKTADAQKIRSEAYSELTEVVYGQLSNVAIGLVSARRKPAQAGAKPVEEPLPPAGAKPREEGEIQATQAPAQEREPAGASAPAPAQAPARASAKEREPAAAPATARSRVEREGEVRSSLKRRGLPELRSEDLRGLSDDDLLFLQREIDEHGFSRLCSGG